MKILVCISNVPDTTTKIKLVNNNSGYDKTGVQWIINPWDELALTRALLLKEEQGSPITEISVINVGTKDTEPTLRKALAVGADDAIRVDAEAKDAYYVAAQIAEVVKNNGYDIVLCGIESSDYNGSAVGGMLSELLDVPSVSSVSGLFIEDGKVKLNREIDGGTQVLATETPFVAIVQKGIALDPRIPAMRGIMMARKKPLVVLPPADIEALTEYIDYEMPQAKSACKMIDEDNAGDMIRLLHEEAKAI
ncbi:MAG: electron transfer flavoprotein subunit beta/FixA family protein [Bacteroidales bacterium]|nr:electron transfer flavoprotein subunit beta/FixA family protein [Bacteroidales bacterium]MCF8455974.1 electron transfer flavoprotein subunit beta/FixA family protein [Bacteroidales bacterium]